MPYFPEALDDDLSAAAVAARWPRMEVVRLDQQMVPVIQLQVASLFHVPFLEGSEATSWPWEWASPASAQQALTMPQRSALLQEEFPGSQPLLPSEVALPAGKPESSRLCRPLVQPVGLLPPVQPAEPVM